MTLKRWAQLLLVISISTLIAAVANVADSRVLWVILTTISHVALVAVGSAQVRRR